jgi:hypothetical protein
MYQEENAHYSLYYAVKNAFSGELEVKDSFPRSILTVPTISIELSTVDFTRIQIGDYNNIRKLQWIFDVFSKNKTQRDRAVFKLFTILEKKIPIYDFSGGFSPFPTTEIGALSPVKLNIEFITVSLKDVEELHYRAAGVYVAEILTY